MSIAVIGACGRVGRRVVTEARQRGHAVTAVVRRPAESWPAGVRVEIADAAEADDVARVAAGHDLVILATRSAGGSVEDTVAVMSAALEGVRRAGVRLLVVGGAATLRGPDHRVRFTVGV